MLTDAEFVLIAREVKARTGAVVTRDMSASASVRLQPLARREGYASVSEMISPAWTVFPRPTSSAIRIRVVWPPAIANAGSS